MDVRPLFRLLRQEYGLSNNDCVLYYEIYCLFFYGGKSACYASNEYFEIELGISSGTVKRSLNTLKQKGLVQIRTEKVKNCILVRNIYPLEDEILIKEANKIKLHREELFKLKADHFDLQEDHQEDHNVPLQEDHFDLNQEDHNDPSIIDIYNSRSLNLKEDIPEDHFGATAPVATSGNERVLKPEFEKDPKETWNTIATRYNLAKLKILSKSRIQKLKARIKMAGGENEFWQEVEEALKNSPFLRGQNTSWKASFDFFLRESSFIKASEGVYKEAEKERELTQQEKNKLVLEEYRRAHGA